MEPTTTSAAVQPAVPAAAVLPTPAERGTYALTVATDAASVAATLTGASTAASLPMAVNEEETIESSKYVPAVAPRKFEEERFLFPASYGLDKVRLLIKDPEWLFAHWDVDPRSFQALRVAHGERVVALARLTLRVHDPLSGGGSVVLLPIGARSWYVRADEARRSYRAELGVTLPSGAFHRLAESNTVVMPRRTPSESVASEKIRFELTPSVASEPTPEDAPRAVAAQHEERQVLASNGPWQAPPPAEARLAEPLPFESARPRGYGETGLGGASDLHRR